MQRPAPRNAFEWLERGWRPALAWLLILVFALPVAGLVATVCVAVAIGVLKAVATGQSMPDITGGLDRILTPMVPYIFPAISALLALLFSRHREVQTQLGGGQVRPPFEPSSPPPSAANSSQEPLINPHGGPDAP